MKITIWGDFACPFCYIGETMLEKTLSETETSAPGQDAGMATIEFKAYELDPDAPVIPSQSMLQHFASSHDISEEDAMNQMQRIAKMAKRNGLDYNIEGVKVCSTLDAHRLMKFAATKLPPEKVLSLNFALFKANFTDNLTLSDRKTLADIAERQGLDRNEVESMFESGRFTEDVRKDEKEADSHNLEFIPYILFENGEVLQGIFSPGAIKKSLSVTM